MEGTRLRTDMITGGSVGIKVATASPLVVKNKATAKKITLVPIQGACSMASSVHQNEAVFSPQSPDEGPQRLLIDPIASPLRFPGRNLRSLKEADRFGQVGGLPGSGSVGSGKLQKSSSLPKLIIDPGLMSVPPPESPSVSASSNSPARGNALLLVPTASPLKLTRSRSVVQMGESVAVAARQELPFQTVRRSCPEDLSEADLQALDRSMYYERKDTVIDVLMQWDYQAKKYVFSAH